MAGQIHVIGAGLAGLAAAVRLTASGHQVTLYEAGDHAGGRCRSYFDAALGCRLDNGNHLLLAANRQTRAYLGLIGAAESLVGPAETIFPFCDLATGRRWVLRPNRGRIPWWIFSPSRRIPDTRAGDYLELLRLWRAGNSETVVRCLRTEHPLFQRLWGPLTIAALNTAPEEASARLLWRVLAASFGAGGAACRPLVPAEGLSESFVDPALAFLAGRGAPVRFGQRLRMLDIEGPRLRSLGFAGDSVALAAGDRVVLAVPAPVAAGLLPGLAVPNAFRAIVNAHYRVALPPTEAGFLGLVGGLAEWVFIKRDVLSVTISAADRLVDRAAPELAAEIWRDVARAFDRDPAVPPPWRIVKERRATFAATPAQLLTRPGATTRWGNLFLAGDWTDTGLPSTIEGAIDSGLRAADLVAASA